jgi:EamA domain-containing membrane protein RarD
MSSEEMSSEEMSTALLLLLGLVTVLDLCVRRSAAGTGLLLLVLLLQYLGRAV